MKRETVSFLVFGPLSKHVAGTRPLTDKERRGLIRMTYGMLVSLLFWQWRAIKAEEEVIDNEVRHNLNRLSSEINTSVNDLFARASKPFMGVDSTRDDDELTDGAHCNDVYIEYCNINGLDSTNQPYQHYLDWLNKQSFPAAHREQERINKSRVGAIYEPDDNPFA